MAEKIEELLKRLRTEKQWTYVDVLNNLRNRKLTERDIKKWEVGLAYPDLETIYLLSEIYMVPSEEFIQAKNKSFEKGMNSIHFTMIKWISYFLNISIKVATVIIVLIYVALLIGSLLFFTSMLSMVDKSKI